MSIVAVHGPQTFGSRAVQSAGPVTATVNPTDGTIWTFSFSGGTRPATDYVWTYTPAGGAPASPINGVLSTTIDFTTTGAKSVTLTVANTTDTVSNKALSNNIATITTSAAHGLLPGYVVTITGVDATFNGTFTILTVPTTTTFTFAKVAADVTSAGSTGTVTSGGSPAAGTYPITVTAYTGTGAVGTSPMMVRTGEETGEEPPPEGEVSVGYDPAAHTVDEVKEFVTEHPDEAQAMYDAELAGKNRATLISWLEENLPFDPGEHTVAEVEEFVTANPELVDEVLATEQAGKNRVTLVTWLEEFQSEEG
jgi:hypothetical protein